MSQPGAVIRGIIQFSETQGVPGSWLTSILLAIKLIYVVCHVTKALSLNSDVHTLCGDSLRSV